MNPVPSMDKAVRTWPHGLNVLMPLKHLQKNELDGPAWIHHHQSEGRHGKQFYSGDEKESRVLPALDKLERLKHQIGNISYFSYLTHCSNLASRQAAL